MRQTVSTQGPCRELDLRWVVKGGESLRVLWHPGGSHCGELSNLGKKGKKGLSALRAGGGCAVHTGEAQPGTNLSSRLSGGRSERMAILSPDWTV